MADAATATVLDEHSRAFYRDALGRLDDAGIEYLVGGAYAFARYTGIERHTKDFDIFIRREDFERIAKVMGEAGYESELTFPHWLGKSFYGDDFIDLIFSAGNGVAKVDDQWFERAVPGEVIGMDVRLIPAEEIDINDLGEQPLSRVFADPDGHEFPPPSVPFVDEPPAPLGAPPAVLPS